MAAKYLSIRDKILDLIAEMDVGEALPPERVLAPRFDVARMTLRRAIDEVVREGRLRRKHGAGTFVAGPKIAQGLVVTSFSEDMRQRGWAPSSRTLDVGELAASPKLARRLEISAGEPVLRVVRLRLADDAPMALETLHVPTRVAPGLRGQELDAASFYELLTERYGLVLVGGVQTIEVTVTNEREAQILDVPPHSPAFLFERVSRAGGGQVVEFVRAVYRGDRYQFRVVLEPADGAAAVDDVSGVDSVLPS